MLKSKWYGQLSLFVNEIQCWGSQIYQLSARKSKVEETCDSAFAGWSIKTSLTPFNSLVSYFFYPLKFNVSTIFVHFLLWRDSCRPSHDPTLDVTWPTWGSWPLLWEPLILDKLKPKLRWDLQETSRYMLLHNNSLTFNWMLDNL